MKGKKRQGEPPLLPYQNRWIPTLRHALISAAISLLCALSLLPSTWGWFSSDASAAAADIRTARYEVSVTASTILSGSSLSPGSNSDNSVVYGNIKQSDYIRLYSYRFTLAPVTGDTNTSTGYCIIAVGGNYYYAQTTSASDSITFTYHPTVQTSYSADELAKVAGTVPGTVRITWYWGTYSDARKYANIPASATISELPSRTLLSDSGS